MNENVMSVIKTQDPGGLLKEINAKYNIWATAIIPLQSALREHLPFSPVACLMTESSTATQHTN